MSIKLVFLVALGFLFLALGAIGLFLPLWPVTPFVLLSAACFSGAPALRKKIMRIGFFKEHIENYERRTGLSRKTFWISIIWLWSMLLLSMIFIHTLWISFSLFLIGLAVTCHILRMAKGRKGDEHQ